MLSHATARAGFVLTNPARFIRRGVFGSSLPRQRRLQNVSILLEPGYFQIRYVRSERVEPGLLLETTHFSWTERSALQPQAELRCWRKRCQLGRIHNKAYLIAIDHRRPMKLNSASWNRSHGELGSGIEDAIIARLAAGSHRNRAFGAECTLGGGRFDRRHLLHARGLGQPRRGRER